LETHVVAFCSDEDSSQVGSLVCFQEELAQLRQQSLAEQRARQQQQQAAAVATEAARRAADAAADAKSASAAAAPPDETTELLMRTVKVSWDPTVGKLLARGWPVFSWV
jgi:hypothetical protein